MNYSKQDSILTDRLLKLISRRLSSRIELKGTEYICSIEENKISFEPNIIIYPSTHRRKDSDKINILEFILNKYFQSTHKFHRTKEGSIVIESGKFICGTYKYVKSINGKQRKWIRKEEQ